MGGKYWGNKLGHNIRYLELGHGFYIAASKGGGGGGGGGSA